MNPKITVITVSYNSASTIEETIRSVISQDYPLKEYIIIDGASTDATVEIIQRYSHAIDFFVSEPDKGISNAFNKGISHATGDLIVLINSDDYLMPGALQKVADTWDGKSEIWSGNYLAYNEETNQKFRIRPSLSFPTMPFFKHTVHQGRFITRSLYDRLGGYDENVKVPMDLEFLMRATRCGASFQYVDTDVAVFRLGGKTDESILGKKDDYLYVVRRNGGSALQAYLYYSFLVIIKETKKLLSKTGCDIVHSLRYKQSNEKSVL